MARVVHGEAESSPTRSNETRDFSRHAHQCHTNVLVDYFGGALGFGSFWPRITRGGPSRIATLTYPHEGENGGRAWLSLGSVALVFPDIVASKEFHGCSDCLYCNSTGFPVASRFRESRAHESG